MDWLEMLVKLIGAIAVIDLVAVLLAGTHSFTTLSRGKNRSIRRILLGVAGGLFGIYATMAGYAMPSGAQISIRDVGALLGGALGGPIGGLIAGGMAGVFRLFYPFVYAGLKGNALTYSFGQELLLGTTIPCAISTFVIGLTSGFLHEKFKKAKHRGYWGLLMGFVAEVFHLSLAFGYLCIPIESISRVGGAAYAWETLKDLIAPFILSNAVAFGLLIFVFDKMRSYRDTEVHAQQVEGELGVATSIQDSMLPKIFPDFPGRKEFSINASMQPAKEVGGDFYDFFFIDPNHFAFLIADVSGKGVPAALFMVIAKTLIKNNLQSGLPLAEAMDKTNQQLLEGDDERMFVTCFVAVFEVSSGKLTYCNCGHNPPLFSRAGEPFQYIRDRSGFVLAGSKKTHYKTFEATLREGDRAFLYTDGITEAMNKNGEQYGEERLLAFANGASAKDTTADAIKLVNEQVRSFAAGVEQSDDMTMLALRVNGFYKKEKFEVNRDNLDILSSFMRETLEGKKVPEALYNSLDIVIDEIYSNIVKYSEAKEVDFSIFVGSGLLSLKFEYGGVLYDITKSKEPDLHAPSSTREVGGLGLFMVRKLSDRVSYEAKGQMNVVTIDKAYGEARKEETK